MLAGVAWQTGGLSPQLDCAATQKGLIKQLLKKIRIQIFVKR